TIVLATSQPADGEPEDFVIRYHPDGGLYVGDLVSIEVIPMDEQRFPDSILSVYAEDGTVIDATEFGSFGIGGRYQATLTWAWNTAGLE
ncbi:MAG: hypothetical protein GWN30_25780, partial [Gammaproteobacteria bacterium]|nr:hypothetical protein [Gammaproteobacteria bacterium]